MDKFVVIQWPEIQELMDIEGFEENSYLVNDEKGMDAFGSSAYFVREHWYNKAQKLASARLDTAINHCDEIIDTCKNKDCVTDHKYLKTWLLELRERRLREYYSFLNKQKHESKK